jgi:hypothetical protein
MKDNVISMVEFSNALLATQAPGYIAENLNEACNRTLALATVEACLKSHHYALQERDRAIVDKTGTEAAMVTGRISMLLDLFDDLNIIKKGFRS